MDAAHDAKLRGLDAAIAGANNCTCGPGEACSACPEDEEPHLDAHEGEPAARKRYTPVDLATASKAERDSLLCVTKTYADGLAAADRIVEDGRRRRREPLVDALEQAAIQLRDAELALKAARENYAERLQAFNRFVAPVTG